MHKLILSYVVIQANQLIPAQPFPKTVKPLWLSGWVLKSYNPDVKIMAQMPGDLIKRGRNSHVVLFWLLVLLITRVLHGLFTPEDEYTGSCVDPVYAHVISLLCQNLPVYPMLQKAVILLGVAHV